jgi:cyclopropane fatty-acyl-phospholipid synthase-like methyltransferase
MIENNKNSSATLFRNAWEIYRSVLDQNYMFHRELGVAVNGALIAHFGSKSISMLDLGCGDASQIKKMFAGSDLNNYHGCDLANEPLKMAEKELQDFAKNSKLECADMLECLSKTKDRYDLVFSSFAVHHLSSKSKLDLFKKSHNLLNPDGVLLLIDVTKMPNQDDHAYHNDYLFFARENWAELNPNDLDAIEEHVRAYDQPESVETYQKMAVNAGFSSAKILAQHTWHTAIMFKI